MKLNIFQVDAFAEKDFFAPENQGFKLRWFTPVAEIDLCGHAYIGSSLCSL